MRLAYGRAVCVLLTVFCDGAVGQDWGLGRRRAAVHLRELSLARFRLRLRDLVRLPRSNGRDQATVEASTEQHAVRHLAHETLAHGLLQRLSQYGQVHLRTGNDGLGALLVAVPPVRVEVARGRTVSGVVDVAGREGDDVVALVDERFELGREVDRARARGGAALVERRDANGVARGDDTRGCNGLVEQHEGEHAVEQSAEVLAVLSVLRGSGDSKRADTGREGYVRAE